jgi:hypothetical protein
MARLFYCPSWSFPILILLSYLKLPFDLPIRFLSRNYGRGGRPAPLEWLNRTARRLRIALCGSSSF